ncbi:MAG: AmmeMemoRadiSam system radical SAM enzyme [Magnetococcales bacterium]|nr:AmmeMemoRadiSam system radical SAM enzyme [Magnetococcales bacterium]NGZ04824.1 AmmeMemoRadiSam system radical SAM enzyme [Magnetococcales bacterium]
MRALECTLCPRSCVIPEGGAGDCRVRVHLDGKLVAVTYGRPSAIHIDPMEKKPLFHFLPGTSIFSIATAGCNLHCRFCQNWQLSQRGAEEMEVVYQAPPDEVVAMAMDKQCQSIAYTYSEPLVFYEYTRATSEVARDKGLKNVLVSAGYINRAPMRALATWIDAANIDIKAFDDRFYRDVCGATLKPVLDALVIMKEANVWIEITNLVIPGLNDDLARVREMAVWIRRYLGAGTPLHFSRFYPMYQMQNLPPTPAETLIQCRTEALSAGLEHVYVGNLAGNVGEETRCPRDNTLLIRRFGFTIQENRLENGRCPVCRQAIAGVWA